MQYTHFFKTDAIEHFRIDIDGEALSNLEFRDDLSDTDQLKKQILFDDQQPVNIKENHFIDSLESLGFIKNKINQSKLEKIQSIFKLKEVASIEPAYCGAVYRDILVFYLNDQIIGMAKLCFSCGHHVIVGTTLNTNTFGQQEDYQTLHNLLKSQ